LLSHQKGKKKQKAKQRKTNKTKQNIPDSNAIQFQLVFQHAVLFPLLSHQRKKKKRVWRQFCEWLSEAVARLPAAVNLLLLEALFMQISEVSVALTWPHRLCLLRVLLCMSHCYKLSLSKHTEGGGAIPPPVCLFQPACLFTVHVGSAPFPPSSVAFLMTATFRSFPAPRLLGWGCHFCLLQLACLFMVL
jgi:hypothetical protein